MILKYCELYDINCRIYHKSVRKGNELVAHVVAPESRFDDRDKTPFVVRATSHSVRAALSDSHAPTVNFFVRDNHCFWYGKVLSELGKDKRPWGVQLNQPVLERRCLRRGAVFL